MDKMQLINLSIYGDVLGTINVAGNNISSVFHGAARAASVQRKKYDPTQIRLPVFVSYASDDREKVNLLVSQLQEGGYTVWLDQNDIKGGEDWQRSINEGIRKCAAVIAVLTPNAIRKIKNHTEENPSWIRFEHTEALRRFVPTIPVKLEKFNDADIPSYFQRLNLQYVDLTEKESGTYSNFERLKVALESVLHRRGLWLVDQTPGAMRTFVGRQTELEAIVDLIRECRGGGAFIAIHGMGGIGKTSLLYELLRRLGPRYPGGVIVEHRGRVNLRDPIDVFKAWTRLIGQEVKGDIRPDDIRGQLSSAGQLIVVLDDIWPEDNRNTKILIEALPQDAICFITTRNEDLAHNLGAQVYTLEKLDEDDGVAMLRERMGSTAAVSELRRLYQAVDGHPLALELAAGRFRRVDDLDKHIDGLEQQIKKGKVSEIAARIPGLELGKDDSVLISLDETRRALEDNDPELIKRFSMLGVFAAGTTVDMSAINAIWGNSIGSADDNYEDVIKMLIGYSLLDDSTAPLKTTESDRELGTQKRYSQHVILRSYALNLLESTDYLDDTLNRHTKFYINIAESLNDDNWLAIADESVNIALALDRVSDIVGKEIVDELGKPATPKTPPTIDRKVAELALEATLRTIGYVNRFQVQQGEKWIKAGLASARLLGFHKFEILVMNNLGAWFQKNGRPETALEYYQQSIRLAEALGYYDSLAVIYNNIGASYLYTNSYREALKNFRVGLFFLLIDLKHRDTEKDRVPNALNNIGLVYRKLGDYRKALEYYQRSLASFKRLKQPSDEAICFHNIGGLYGAMGLAERAIEYYEKAEGILQEIGAIPQLAVSLYEMAFLCIEIPSLGRTTDAIPMLRKALQLTKEYGVHFDATGTIIDDYRELLAFWESMAEVNDSESVSQVPLQADIRDWGHVRRLIEAYPYMLQQETVSNLRSFTQMDESTLSQEQEFSLNYLDKLLEECRTLGIPEAFERLWEGSSEVPDITQEVLLRFVVATSPEAKREYLVSHPELLSSDVDLMIESLIRDSADAGDEGKNLARILTDHHELLRLAREIDLDVALEYFWLRYAIVWLGNAPTLEAKREVIHKHPKLLSTEAQAILDANMAEFLRENDTKSVKILKDRQELLKWCSVLGVDETIRMLSDPLNMTIVEFTTISWLDKPGYLKSHPELLSPKAESIFNDRISVFRNTGRENSAGILGELQRLLIKCREGDISEIFKPVVLRELIIAFVNTRDITRKQSLLDKHSELLLPEVLTMLEQDIINAKREDNLQLAIMLEQHRDLLRDVKSLGMETAFKRFN